MYSVDSIVPIGVHEECTVCAAEEFADSGTVGIGVPPCCAVDELVRFFDLNTFSPLGSLARITICGNHTYYEQHLIIARLTLGINVSPRNVTLSK